MASPSSILTGAIESALPGALTGNMLSNPAFIAAGQAMAELGVAGCIGAACVRQDYITAEMIRTLSKTAFSLLLPMHLGTSIMKTVGKYGIDRSSLAIPIMAVMNSLLLYNISKHLLMPLFGIHGDTDLGRSTVVCCAWGNSGVVPLIFIEALFRHESPAMLAKGIAHVSMFLVGWSPFFWSFGRSVLLGDDNCNSNRITITKQSSAIKNRAPSVWGNRLKTLFPPPVVGVIIGLLTMLSPLGWLFMSDESAEGKAPLSIIFNSFENLGRASNPLLLLVLTSSLAIGVGGSVANPDTNNGNYAVDDKGRKACSNNFLRQWACVSISRFVMSPLVMVALMKCMAKIKMIDTLSEDPMLWFIMLLESCMPPAQNSVLMLNSADKPAEASKMAKFLFPIYATGMIPIVIIVTIALKHLKLM